MLCCCAVELGTTQPYELALGRAAAAYRRHQPEGQGDGRDAAGRRTRPAPAAVQEECHAQRRSASHAGRCGREALTLPPTEAEAPHVAPGGNRPPSGGGARLARLAPAPAPAASACVGSDAMLQPSCALRCAGLTYQTEELAPRPATAAHTPQPQQRVHVKKGPLPLPCSVRRPYRPSRGTAATLTRFDSQAWSTLQQHLDAATQQPAQEAGGADHPAGGVGDADSCE